MLLLYGLIPFPVCFPSQLMKLFHKSFIRLSVSTNGLLNQNWLALNSKLLIMLERYTDYLLSKNFNKIFQFGTRCIVKKKVDLAFYQVLYQSDQFLEKNKDYVVPEHQDLLNSSKCPFVAGLFPPLSEETSKNSKFSSIGSRFKVV